MGDEGLKKRTRWAIEYVCKVNNLTNKTLAAVLGLKTSNLSQYRSMAVRPSYDFVKIFCGKYSFSHEWFISGDGEPFLGAREKFPEICGPPPIEKKIQKVVDFNVADDAISSISKGHIDNVRDLPDAELDLLIDNLKRLSKRDVTHIISRLTTGSRRGDLDSSLLKSIHAAMKEFFAGRDKKELDSVDFAASLILHTIYRELRIEPSRGDLIAVIDVLYQLGRIYPVGVPLTPHEQRELFTWGRKND